MHFKCVKNKTTWQLKLYIAKSLWQTHNEKAWMVYEKADSWDALLLKVVKRKDVRFCCDRTQKAFDKTTDLMYDCVKSYRWAIV